MPSVHDRGELFRLSLDKITTMRGTSGELGRTYRRRSPRRTEPLHLVGGDRGIVGGSLGVLGEHLGVGELDSRQYFWLETHTGAPITNALADLLTDGTRHLDHHRGRFLGGGHPR